MYLETDVSILLLPYIIGQGCYSLYDEGSKPWHVSTLSKSSGIPASLCAPLGGGGAPTMVLGEDY